MKRRKRWSEQSRLTRAIALHEAGHGVLGEALGWRVQYLSMDRREGGLCQFRSLAPSLWVDTVVSAAGHAAERNYFGRVIGSGSAPDRECAYDALEVAGLDLADSIGAAEEIEAGLWPVFTAEAVERAVLDVARALADDRCLTRREFLALAEPALRRSTRQHVRRFCRRLAHAVHAKNFTFEDY